MIFNKLSLKQKSLLFMLFLISIMLFTLYYQHRVSYKNYLYLLQDSYKTSLDNQYNSFLKNMKKNYQNIIFQFENKNTQEIKRLENKLKINNPFLKNITIIHSPNKLDLKQLHSKQINIIEIKNIPYYRLLFSLKKVDNKLVLAEFLVDTKSFLNEIKEFNNSDGLIHFINKKNESVEYRLKSSIYNNDFKELVETCRVEKKDLFNINSKFYVSKSFLYKDENNKNEHSIIFFLDVTKEKLAYKDVIRTSIVTSILLFIIAAIFLNYFLNFLIKRINKNEENLKEINKNLEQTVEKEIKHKLEIQKSAQDEKEQNEQLLIQQSKLAMMGEMIGNIAHQWRQPLMQLSAIIMYIDAYDEKGKLTKEKLRSKIKDSNSIIDFMSKTIEDFRNYYKPEKQKESFLIKDSIEGALFIIDSCLKNSNINISINYKEENLRITSFKNEFSQALLNIISNASDVLIQRNIKNPIINIEVFSKEDKIFITIQDNAAGISKDIIQNIFDPYFTTKHKSQGTGIGLYMTKMIIENNINGKIDVENTDIGAKFTITLNISK